MQQAVEKLHLSARSYYKIIKISRTIADLSQSKEITLHHIADALQFRQKVSEVWKQKPSSAWGGTRGKI